MFSVTLGDKVLVFSHSILTLDLLEAVVKNTKVNGRDLKWSRLDGKTAMSARQQSTKDFNAGDCDVFLISTQAGGLGLNLPGANRVIIFDYKWTPMPEQQAVGRAYRLGQRKHVYVYRFRAGGTFENSLWNTSQYKTQLQSRVVDRKAPMREAYRNGKEQFHPPAIIVKQDLQEFVGKDEVLDRMLTEKEYVYDISYTETFRPDHEDILTPEEYRETELILEREQAERQKANGHSLTQNAGPSAMAPNTPTPSSGPVLGIPVSAANTIPKAPTLMAPVTVPSHRSPDIPNYNLGVPNFNLDVPNSNLDVPNFNLDVPNSNLDVPNFNLDVPNFNLDVPNFNLDVPNSNLDVPNFNLDVPNSNLDVQNFNLDVPNSNLDVQNFNLDVPNSNLDVQNFNLDVPNSNLDVQNFNLDVPNSNPDNSPGANRFGFKFGPGSLPRVFRGPR